MQTLFSVAEPTPVRTQRPIFAATALEWAAKHGQEATARHSLEAGTSPDAVYDEEFVPTALACIYGHEGIVRLLLDYGVDPSLIRGWANFDEEVKFSEIGDWEYPMFMAARRGHESVVKLLLAHGAAAYTPLDNGDTPIARAAAEGHLSITKLLASGGAGVDVCTSDGFTPICLAALTGNAEVVRFLVEMRARKEGAGPNGEIPLCLAAERGHIEVIKVLLEFGANLTPPVENVTVMALAKAANAEHYAAVEFLRNAIGLPDVIPSGHPGDRNHRMLLLVGATCGWDDLVRQLLEQGCSPDAVASRSETFSLIAERTTQNRVSINRLWHPSALALAAYRGRHQIVETLLRHGAKFHEEPGGDQEPSPLYLAIAGNHPRIVETLLDNGASPDWRDSNGDPVLFRVAGAPEIFELLLDRGADLTEEANDGESIIARALSSGSIPTIES